MKSLSEFAGCPRGMTVVITDSGLGGLQIGAELERRLRRTGGDAAVHLIYFNAWPDARHGFNDLPDLAARAGVFDQALAAMTVFGPDLILIACNTLSVVYEATAFRRAPAVPVTGILDEGAGLFCEALIRDPQGVLVLFGTRTTIGSGEHVARLARCGVDPRRVITEPCHGLAAAIDKNPDSPALPGMVEECVARVAPRLPAGAPLYAGLACTHYAYVAEAFQASLGRHAKAKIVVIDPGKRLVDNLMEGLTARKPGNGDRRVSIEVVSKIELPEAQRLAVARRIEPRSSATARALLEYRHVPDLF